MNLCHTKLREFDSYRPNLLICNSSDYATQLRESLVNLSARIEWHSVSRVRIPLCENITTVHP